MNTSVHRFAVSTAVAALLAAGCGSSAEPITAAPPTAEAEPAATEQAESAARGIRRVTAQDGAAIQNDPPTDLVILDVRTPDEFAEGHLDGAIMIDFYDADFADQLAELDPDVPYLLYCRSGNRSGQTATLMEQLGFTDVADIDGGILSWTDAGLPTVNG